jgi:poly-gamma-glutamate capsule biosynthesis protein CapA/YwtB (metallophosphatase superfamily)
VIVSGSQAHQPHGFEFYNGSLIHYGLGNLFFDQYNEVSRSVRLSSTGMSSMVENISAPSC